MAQLWFPKPSGCSLGRGPNDAEVTAVVLPTLQRHLQNMVHLNGLGAKTGGQQGPGEGLCTQDRWLELAVMGQHQRRLICLFLNLQVQGQT